MFSVHTEITMLPVEVKGVVCFWGVDGMFSLEEVRIG
jgi:hypothetical protein